MRIQRTGFLFLLISILWSLQRVPTYALCGDITQDGKVDLRDATRGLQSAVGRAVLPPEAIASGDLNMDGKITIADVVLILRLAIGTLKPEVATCREKTLPVVTTVVGDPLGFSDGFASQARFSSPENLAIGPSGEIYVTDRLNHRIRKITPDGQVSTIAGTGKPGFKDGPGNQAEFFQPVGITVDAKGNIYVADMGNQRIRKITPDGVVTTIAGNPTIDRNRGDLPLGGFADGPALSAQFNNPAGLALDTAGNLYIADMDNHRIRKLTPNGQVITIAGGPVPGFRDDKGTKALFNQPTSVTVLSDNRILVTDFGNQLIREIAPDGTVSIFTGNPRVDAQGNILGGFEDGDPMVAQFDGPASIARDQEDNLYIADTNNHRIRKVSPDGTVSTLAGDGNIGSNDGDAGTARFFNPDGVAVDAKGNVYVADTENNVIRKITPDGRVSTVAGRVTVGYQDGPAQQALIFAPEGLAFDTKGNLYFADTGNHRIRKLSPDGKVTTVAGNGTPGFQDGPALDAQFNEPTGVAVDDQGNIYVTDRGNHRIRKISPDGQVTTLAGSDTPGFADGVGVNARFARPRNLTLAPDGYLYVADTFSQRIRRVNPATGEVVTIAGGGNGAPGFSDGMGSLARFSFPQSLAVGPDGNLYVTDGLNHMIRRVTPEGEVTTIVGNPPLDAFGQPLGDFADGPALSARLSLPTGIVVGPDGIIYFTDRFNHRIRRVVPPPDSKVETLAGSDFVGFVDGPGDQARFRFPLGIALDAQGNLYVSDPGNHRIRKITLKR